MSLIEGWSLESLHVGVVLILAAHSAKTRIGRAASGMDHQSGESATSPSRTIR
jgi:hypothetical protein